ncbi:uncharacterized protein LOC142586712 [Dermacentor variabilis]|uniref:uncharacterized protein LOC142586712 n=1 Tax=Dermacentor variabilis TaxID=34621 RepID=UPI003F5C0B44
MNTISTDKELPSRRRQTPRRAGAGTASRGRNTSSILAFLRSHQACTHGLTCDRATSSGTMAPSCLCATPKPRRALASTFTCFSSVGNCWTGGPAHRNCTGESTSKDGARSSICRLCKPRRRGGTCRQPAHLKQPP